MLPQTARASTTRTAPERKRSKVSGVPNAIPPNAPSSSARRRGCCARAPRRCSSRRRRRRGARRAPRRRRKAPRAAGGGRGRQRARLRPAAQTGLERFCMEDQGFVTNSAPWDRLWDAAGYGPACEVGGPRVPPSQRRPAPVASAPRTGVVARVRQAVEGELRQRKADLADARALRRCLVGGFIAGLRDGREHAPAVHGVDRFAGPQLLQHRSERRTANWAASR